MNSVGLRRVLPFTAAAVFFALGFARASQRAVWLALGVVFFVLGLVRRTR